MLLTECLPNCMNFALWWMLLMLILTYWVCIRRMNNYASVFESAGGGSVINGVSLSSFCCEFKIKLIPLNIIIESEETVLRSNIPMKNKLVMLSFHLFA